MGVSSLPQRLARAVGESPVADRVADAQKFAYGPIIDWARRSPLHTDVLGHSVHPLLTDLTLGCWISASILDLAGGSQSRRAATLLVAAGLAAAGPTALAGTGDWAEMSGTERRIGAVHALGTDIATFLLLGSLVARMRGRYPAGTKLGLAGNLAAAGAGFLGGHLALNRGTARRVADDYHAARGGHTDAAPHLPHQPHAAVLHPDSSRCTRRDRGRTVGLVRDSQAPVGDGLAHRQAHGAAWPHSHESSSDID